MKRFVSIKSKLLVLLLATIILILMVIGLSLAYLIEQYYEGESDKRFTRVYAELSAQLREREGELNALAQRLSLRSDVVSSVNMIFQYAKPEDYLPLVYDGEKGDLAKIFANEAKAGAIDEIAAYDADGQLISYFSNINQESMGFISYRDSKPVVLTHTTSSITPWETGTLPPTLSMQMHEEKHLSDTAHYRYLGDYIVAEYDSKVFRTYPDGKQLLVGFVKVRKYITNDFITELSKKTGVSLNLLMNNAVHFGRIKGINVNDIGRIKSTAVITETLPFTRLTLNQYFAAAMGLQLKSGEEAVFLAVVPREVVDKAIKNTRLLVLLVLLLSAAVIVPIGIIVSNRAISRPLDKLAEGVEAIERGDYFNHIEIDSHDELSALAHAFNVMSDSISQREQALVESEDKYRNLVDNLPQRIFFKDRQSVYVSCNSRFASDAGLAPDEIVGKTDFDLYSERYARQYRLDDDRIMRNGEIEELEEPYKTETTEGIIQTVKTPIRNADGDVIGILGIFWDITEKKQAENRLRQSAAVFESTADGVIVTDAQAKIIAVNKAFCEITGYSEEEARGQNPSFRRSERQDEKFYREMWRSIERNGRWQGEIWNRRKTGEVYPEWMTISVVRDAAGNITNYVAVFSDITHVKRSQMQLDHMAHHDPLTDLPNRTLLDDRLNQAIRRAERNDSNVAVLFIDLDRFKNVNDTLGHPTGDLLLQEVAQRIRGLLRQQDTVARLSGDEFIILIEDMDRPEVAETVASKVIDILASPFTIREHELFIGASIGISLYPADGESPANLIKYADTAMYRAKEQGRNTYQFYTQELTESAMERLELESALRRALKRDQFEIYYQPQVNLETGEIIGAEALLRWYHPEYGMVPPDKFILLAEESGLIVDIGDWVIQQACKKAREWQTTFPNFRRMAINLSAVQIQRRDLVDKVASVINACTLQPELLELEITESVLMQNPEIAEEMLQGLRGLGVELAIDDFGTGYSSLGYLKRFPIQKLKIDRSFVMDIPEDGNDTAITRAVIALGKSLQLKVVAEGVETAEQAAFLLQEGCDIGQGYHYSRPVSADAFEALLADGLGVGAEATNS